MVLSFRGYLGEVESERTKAYNFAYTFFLLCSFVSGSVLPIFKSKFAKAVGLEPRETSSVFWLAQLVLCVLFLCYVVQVPPINSSRFHGIVRAHVFAAFKLSGTV